VDKLSKKKIWELKQSVDNPNTLEMYIYGNIEGDYFDWWDWEVKQSETSANYFRDELKKYENIENIVLYVNSYGGSVFEAISIRNQLKRHSAQVTAYVDGFACSAASFILTGCDKVIMYSNTMQMIHNAINVAVGNSTQLRKAADDLDAIMEGNRQAYLEKSNGKITEEELIQLLENETWLTANECLKYGFADEVANQEVDLTNAKELLQKVNMSLEQTLSYNKALVAQVREFTQRVPKVEPTEPQAPIGIKQLTNAEKIKMKFNKNN